MSMKQENETLKSASQIAQILGISRPTLCRLMQRKKIGYYRVGTRVLFSDEHIAAFLQSCECKPQEEALRQKTLKDGS